MLLIVEELVRGDLVVNMREGRMLGVVPQLGPPFMELSEHFGPYRNQLLMNSYALSNKTWHAVANGQNLSANRGAGGLSPRFSCA